MADLSAVNLSSLGILGNELDETLRLAGSAWQKFVDDPNDKTPLKSAAQSLLQANGALRMIELRGLAALSEDLHRYAEQLISSERAPASPALLSVSSILAAMPRYLEFVRATGHGKPVLLAPAITEVRALAGLSRLPEFRFSQFKSRGEISLPELDAKKAIDQEKLSLTVRRLRQMYQTGLIAIIRKEGDPAMHLGLMQRACERMYGCLRTAAASERWLLNAAVISSLASRKLELNASRARWLSSLDRSFREFLSNLEDQLGQKLGDSDRDELLYLISLSEQKQPLASLAIKDIVFEQSDCEQTLREERAYVYGHNLHVEQARLDKLGSLLSSAREYLDLASRANEYNKGELENLETQLESILACMGDTVGETLAGLMLARLQDVKRWVEQPASVSWEGLMPLADALIMLEGVLDNANSMSTEMPDPVANADAGALQSAELAVVTEAQAGLNLAKRAITSFVESGFDRAHLGNIATTLNSVRGGLQLIDLPRAADILFRSTQFIESAINKSGEQDDSILETLADALISLEYYLAQLELRKDADDSVLDVADESLTEIGYPAAA
ncbi:MAG: hypothetical protein AB8B48_09815 [Pseudomonadales bacterium]